MSLVANFNALWARMGSFPEREFQTQALRDLTAGMNTPLYILDRIAAKGWSVQVGNTIPQAMMGLNSDGFVVLYSAEKDGHKIGSASWYRDLCDVLGYPRDAIPDEAVRTRLKIDGFEYH